jgi:membrane-bound lytic murein transglycosylase D
MTLKKLIYFIPCILLIMGCQQTQLTTTGPVSDQPPALPAAPEAKTTKVPSLTAAQQESPAPDKKCDTPKPQTVASQDLDVASQDLDQDKIDQALDLCNYAQDMWEEGRLEDAISNLDSAYFLILEIDPVSAPELNQQKEDIRYLISKRILEIYASRQIVVAGRHEAIPITMNAHVKREIKRLTGPERRFLIQSLERSSKFRPFIVEELKKAGLPEEISWLPLIESGYKIRALSSARALGLWQFIPSTGHKFGLNRNYYIDERMDPEKATRAAIAYLKELHKLFGDWTTALAAYNCGEYRVLKTIRRQKINYLDNFWDLYQSLPRETARYVPRFLATVHIINNLEKYGITDFTPQSPIAYKTVDIKKQILLKDIAREIGVDTNTLKSLNPELRHALLPPETYTLKVPEAKADTLIAKLDKIKSTYAPAPRYVYHRVRRGDTLSGIAKRYKSSVRAISRCNNIRRAHRIIAGKVLKIPSRNNAGGSPGKQVANRTIPSGKAIIYKVKRGDSLWIIAKRFSTTTKQIMAQNGLSGSSLAIGQRLKIFSGQTRGSASKTSTYRVKSGDSPFLIAKRHNMSLNRLLALNKLSKRSTIYPGQKLIVD